MRPELRYQNLPNVLLASPFKDPRGPAVALTTSQDAVPVCRVLLAFIPQVSIRHGSHHLHMSAPITGDAPPIAGLE